MTIASASKELALRSLHRLATRPGWLSVAAILAFGFAAPQASAAPDGWNLTWSDEFDGATLDAAKWTTWGPSTPGPYNNERQEYLPQQVSVAGGNLVITATNQPYSSQYGNYNYRSGRVESIFAQHYGRWEFRAKLPGTKGTWPALWLLPDVDQYPWPTQGEIDILENRGHEPNLTSSAFHFDRNSSPSTTDHQYVTEDQTTARFGQAVNYFSDFHTYAVEWDAQKLRLFVDDVNWYTVYNSGNFSGSDGTTVGGFLASQTAPMQAIMNVAVGGDFIPPNQQPDGSSVWPQQMLVDYVRVYQRDPQAPFKLANGDFEADGGGLAQWTRFGNANNTNNVSVHNEAAHGDAALKLFGQYTGSNNASGVSQGITVAAGDEVRASLSRFIRTNDTIFGGPNSAQMKIEFYNAFGARPGSSALLGAATQTLTIANGSSPQNAWADFILNAVAPAGAVEARLSIIFNQSGNAGGAVHVDDVGFVNARLADTADFNLDGSVDGDDLTLWKAGVGADSGADRADGDANGDGAVDGADFLLWQRQSSPASSAEPVGAPVPEPVAVLHGAAAVAAWRTLSSRRR
jgi:beta-glucanase (GH16 family)